MTTLHWILAIGFEIFFVILVFWSKAMGEKLLWADIGVFIFACWMTLIGFLFGALYSYWLIFNVGLWTFSIVLLLTGLLAMTAYSQHCKSEREYDRERKTKEDEWWAKIEQRMKEAGNENSS